MNSMKWQILWQRCSKRNRHFSAGRNFLPFLPPSFSSQSHLPRHHCHPFVVVHPVSPRNGCVRWAAVDLAPMKTVMTKMSLDVLSLRGPSLMPSLVQWMFSDVALRGFAPLAMQASTKVQARLRHSSPPSPYCPLDCPTL